MAEFFVIGNAIFWWLFLVWLYRRTYNTTWTADFVVLVKRLTSRGKYE